MAAYSKNHWFWSAVRELRPLYSRAALASLLSNIFAFAASIYSMVIYDKVIPSQSMNSLFVLFSGVLLILVVDHGIRNVRTYLFDAAGKYIDQSVANIVFEKIILANSSQPRRDGAVAAAIKDFDVLKEFISAATIATFVDIPFALLFIFALLYLTGWVCLVPVISIIALVVTGYIAHIRMKSFSKEMQAESQSKQATIIEALQNKDLICAMDAGGLFKGRWESAIELQAESQNRSKEISSGAMNFVQLIGQLNQILVLSVGAALAFKNIIGMGTLVAASIMASRAIAPFSQVVSLLSRLSQVMQSYRALDAMILESDQRVSAMTPVNIDISELKPVLSLKQLSLQYPNAKQPVLLNLNLELSMSMVVAVLGKSGAGKSTMLRLISGLTLPSSGDILIDGVNLKSFAQDLRKKRFSFAMQDPMIFSGTLLENITLSSEPPDSKRLMQVISVCCLEDLIGTLSDGLASKVRERGQDFSGGQRQLISIARALYRDVDFYFFDEPTSSLDPATEAKLIHNLQLFLANKAVLFSTHKPKPLDISTHCLVLESGRVTYYDQTSVVLARLNQATNK